MRKVVVTLFISLDGIIESPDQWQFDHFDEDMMEALSSAIADIDTILLGRKTYEEWSQYWPNSTDEPFATFINTTPKVVVSSTLDKVEWGQWDTISLINSNVSQEIMKLKQQPGKNIGINGSVTLVQSLLQENLLDELGLTIHPVIAGSGKRLFNDGDPLKRLQLVESKTSRTGVLIVKYQPRTE